MEEQPSSKKRKITLDKISIPRLKPIPYLICDICGGKIYDYKTCQNNCIYCSYNCLSVLMLNSINNQEYTDFNS